MRIAELVNTLEIGGAERVVVDLTLGMHERGHDVSVICLRETGPLSAPLEAGVEVRAFHKADGFSFGTVRRLAKYLRDKRIDVVHTHNPLVHHYGVLAGRLAGASVILNTVHGIMNLNNGGLTRRVFELTCWQTDRVVAVCKTARDYFQQNTMIPERKLTVIYNGIPMDNFLAISPRRGGPEFVFGAVGRMVPVKDHGMLLRALALVRGLGFRCRLEILGDGPLRPELEQLARDLDLAENVRFHGFRSDVWNFLAGVDAFVLCSLSEGLPLTVLEAMAAGLPVIATSVGGVPELIEDAQCGWLCPPSQTNRLSDMMVAAIQSAELGEMGKRAREKAKAYSVVRMVDEYESLFRSLLPAHKGV
jgi:glycosyltransferase involved in cell wall biosynthesis